MSLRKLTWLGVAFISIIAVIVALYSKAFVAAAVLLLASIFSSLKFARCAPLKPLEPSEFDGWCFALAGRDLFDPDAKPVYEWRGFATTYVVALQVTDHPTLAKSTLFRFRDELSDEEWRRLVTLVRHGPHTLRSRTLLGQKNTVE